MMYTLTSDARQDGEHIQDYQSIVQPVHFYACGEGLFSSIFIKKVKDIHTLQLIYNNVY